MQSLIPNPQCNMKRFLLFIFLCINCTLTYAQVKIGNNPSSIHSNSILELESTDKVLVISRMTTAQINAITPLKGALVYNTDRDCVYMFDGTSWRSLCNAMSGIKVTTEATSPSNNNIGDFWINPSENNKTHIWDGTQWIAIDNNPTRGNGAPNNTTAPTPSAGDVYVDTSTGNMYAYDGTTWVQSGGNVKANNGLLVSADNTVQLGGTLIQPTIISTDTTNTLAIEGLQEGDITEDDIVTVNRTTGQLRKITSSALFREEVAVITANDGDLQFAPALPISDSKKINVYRNGVRIDFTVVNNTTIEIEPEAVCYAGDQIRIVQFY